MLFNSITYLIFFPLVLIFYWFAPRKYSQPLLLIASYVFYMSWIPVYGILIFLLTVVNYVFGLAIEANRKIARPLLIIGIILNLGVLSYFKYADFLLQSLRHIFRWVHASSLIPPTVPSTLHVILPLAISFFAFEFIHYLSDVFKGDEPIKSPLEFALFASFFPSQIAGPIKRYQDFTRQCHEPRKFDPAKFEGGLAMLLQGLFKKVALADNLATIANTGFAHSANLGGGETWLAVLAFTFQIYFDFSGYTDMGRGSAMMLGLYLPPNFNLPYLASNLSDFWKRWHISLSTWLRDYVYIPLGGGRCSKVRKNINLLVTMLLGGLWHGAAWHFVIWGGIHGLGLVGSHAYSELVDKRAALKKFHESWLGRGLSMVLTFLFVIITWLFFRADTLQQAISMIRHMVSGAESNLLAEVLHFSLLPYAATLYIIGTALSAPAVVAKLPAISGIKETLLGSRSARYPVYVGIYLVAIALSAQKLSSFIYFQF